MIYIQKIANIFMPMNILDNVGLTEEKKLVKNKLIRLKIDPSKNPLQAAKNS